MSGFKRSAGSLPQAIQDAAEIAGLHIEHATANPALQGEPMTVHFLETVRPAPHVEKPIRWSVPCEPLMQYARTRGLRALALALRMGMYKRRAELEVEWWAASWKARQARKGEG